MANPYPRCGKCLGNHWPSGQMEHPHINRRTLKLKYRHRPEGRSVPATPRTNSPSGKTVTLAPRKRAYGPW